MDAKTTRRGFTLMTTGAAASLLAGGAIAASPPARSKRSWLADIHSHRGMWDPAVNLADEMAASGATLVAWALDDDELIQTRMRDRLRARKPASGSIPGYDTPELVALIDPVAGELWNDFHTKVAEWDARVARWGLAKALTPADIDAALAGEARVLMASEAANFLEADPARLAEAHAAGLRHLQLVHFIRSPLGDRQTGEPRLGGLTPAGARVVQACNRLGILVDLAHGTANLVDAALEVSNCPMVWSHSWISPAGGNWRQPLYVARSLAPATAKKLAARGGVVGLWTVGGVADPAYPLRDVGSYADEIVRMCDLIGPDHVGFGTDMDGVGQGPILANYGDLRRVADDLGKRGLSDAVLAKVCIGNYARVVKQAMSNAAKT